jgi:hypothetical protein
VTAVDRIDCERIDHQGFVPEIYAGLMLTSFYLAQLGPNIPVLNDTLEDGLNVSLFAGTLLGLVGVVTGTRLVFPRLRRRISYMIGLCGIPLIILPLALYTYATFDNDNLVMTALSGGLGLCIEVGLLRMFVDLVQDLTTDHSAHRHS